MNDRNVDQLLQAWLDLGPDVAPDRVHSAVALEVRTTRQAFGWSRWASERFTTMRNPARIAAALAAVAVIALLGLRFLVPDNTGDTEPTPTATATVSPTATPLAVRPLPPFGSGGELDPGQYTVEVPDSNVTGTVTIGAGWQSGGWYLMNPPDFTKSISFWTVGNVPTDACDSRGTLPEPPIGPTVDDLVAALDDQANTNMSAPVDVVVGGYAGKRVTLLAPDDNNCGTPVTTWIAADGAQTRELSEYNLPDTVWILDVEGQRVVIVTTTTDDTGEADVTDVMDSLELTVD